MTSTPGSGSRWLVLREQGRHCQCYEGMWHYLDRVGWQVQQPVEWGRDDDLPVTTMRAAIELGLIEHPGRLRTIPFDRPDVASYPHLWSDPQRFVMDYTAGDPDATVGEGLIPTMKHCFGPAEQLAEVEKIQARVERHGLGGLEGDAEDRPGVTFAEQLESLWCYLRAKHLGVDDGVAARMEALVAANPDGEANAWAVRRAERVVEAGDLWDRWRATRRGLSDETLVAVTRAVAEGQGGPLDWEDPYCARAAGWKRDQAEHDWAAYQEERDDDDRRRLESTVARMGWVASNLLDLGCIEGHPGVASDVYEVYAFVATAEERKRPDHAADEVCVQAFEQVAGVVDPAKLEYAGDQPDTLALYALQALDFYYANLLRPRCVQDVRP